MRLSILVVLTFVVSASFADMRSIETDAQELVGRLNGVLNSGDHSLADITYFDVTLTHCKINVRDLPENLEGSHFLYLRQAISLHKANPYRKRIVRVAANHRVNQVTSSNYYVKNQSALDGICDLPLEDRYISYTQDVGDVICTTYLDRENDLFVGGTPPEGCPNSRSGAVKATSEITIGKTWMKSWDRGWNATGNQVWGATEGPYVFRRHLYGAPDSFAVAFGSRLVGKFSNIKQVTANSANFELSELRMCHVKLNGGTYKGDNLFVYMEKKSSSELQQKLYQITADETTGRAKLIANDFVSGRELLNVCDKSEDTRFNLRPQMVEWNKKCSRDYYLDNDTEFFIGKTPEGGCPSNAYGSTYMTSYEKIRFGQFFIWEKWFDAEGDQVAGSEVGPHLYLRAK